MKFPGLLALLETDPGFAATLADSRRRGVTALDVTTVASFFPRLVEAFGAGRIAWGSNFPAHAGTMAALLGEARHALACLSEADQAMIFSGTARRLYPALAR